MRQGAPRDGLDADEPAAHDAAVEDLVAREHAELEQLHHRVKQRMNKRYEELAELLDDRQDYSAAADAVRRLMFLEKLLAEIDDGMAALET